MKKRTYVYHRLFLVIPILFIGIFQVEAQRMNHGASRMGAKGGGVQHSVNTQNRRSINGGAVKSPNRTIRTSPTPSHNAPRTTNRTNNYNRNTNVNNRNSNNRNISGNTVNINVDRSHDINVVNNRNTVVRRNNIATYARPPYVWGGRRYYCYHPYYWGPVWHPWGFFIATLATTAIIVSVADAQYHYDQGVWYAANNGGYTVVQAPVGGAVTTIPSGAQTVVVNNTTNYYYGGAYYEKDGSQYKVVAPPAGAVVDNLPEGGEEVKIGDQTYVKIGETYYQPVQVDGKNKYEVAQVEEE
ncbi:MAG: DUF6515 family protein [Tannerella sp.]|nr:DUF6515 family protein [Tannerella sp.]